MIGVVLAGGKGERLGRSKAELTLDGRTLAQRTAELLWQRCGDVLVSVHAGQELASSFKTVADDAPAGCGPLAGLAACYRASGRSDLLVLACDYPRVDATLLDRIVADARPEAEAVFAVDGRGRDHPLVGLWRREAAARVQAAVEEGRYKVRALLRELTVQRIADERDGVLLNVNRAEDWRAAGGAPI